MDTFGVYLVAASKHCAAAEISSQLNIVLKEWNAFGQYKSFVIAHPWLRVHATRILQACLTVSTAVAQNQIMLMLG